MPVADAVRQVRRSQGLTQREFAARAHFEQSSLAAIESASQDPRGGTLERLLASAGFRSFPLPTTAHSAAEWADEIYRYLTTKPVRIEAAFRALIALSDDLSRVSPALRVALCVAPPPPCGDTRFDAAVAAVVEHHLTQASLPVPSWVFEAGRAISPEWTATPFVNRLEVPSAFLRHGVLLAASELESV